MLNEEIKSMLREQLQWAFDNYSSFIASFFLLNEEIKWNTIGNALTFNAPIIFRKEIMVFFKDEGLFVKELDVESIECSIYEVSMFQ